MGEQVRSQPIVTNRSEMSRGTSNCVKNSNLIIYKAAPRTLSVSNGSVPSAHMAARRLSQSKKKKRRRREGKTSYTVAVKVSSCLNFFLYKCLSICKHKHTHTKTHEQTHSRWEAHACAHTHTHTHTHTAVLPVKDVGKPVRLFTKKSKFIYLFEFRVITGITAVLGCDISL